MVMTISWMEKIHTVKKQWKKKQIKSFVEELMLPSKFHIAVDRDLSYMTIFVSARQHSKALTDKHKPYEERKLNRYKKKWLKCFFLSCGLNL